MLPENELAFVNRQLKKMKLKRLADFYKTEKWQYARSLKRDRPHLVCEICNCRESDTLKVELHHNTYERLGEERGSDLSWLCSDCHDQLHEYVTDLVNGEGIMSFVRDYLVYESQSMDEAMKATPLKERIAEVEALYPLTPA